MRAISLLILSMYVLCMISCNVDETTILDRIESTLESNPLAALDSIRTLDQNDFTQPKSRARLALLHSIALDKNYIDLKTDSIISPAIEYYQHRGSIVNRAKTMYYRGRIASNAGNDEEAMQYFMQAEQYMQDINKSILAGQVYNAKAGIYLSHLDFALAHENQRYASDCFLATGDSLRYALSIANMAVISLAWKDSTHLRQDIARLKESERILTDDIKDKISAYELFYESLVSSTTELALSIEKYLDETEREDIDCATLAFAYIMLEDYEHAEPVVDALCASEINMNSIMLWEIALTYHNVGRYEEASNAYRLYINRSECEKEQLRHNEVKHIEHVFRDKLEKTRQKDVIMLLLLSLVIFVILVIVLNDKYRKIRLLRIKEKMSAERSMLKMQQDNEKLKTEKMRYEEAYASAQKEIEELHKIMESSKITSEVKELIEERLNVLNRFVAASISGNEIKAAELQLQKLIRNKEYFLDSTRHSFALSHKQFVEYLESAGLSDKEIGYCCLYAIGLNGQQIAAYIGLKNAHSYYNLVSSIRKRLDIKDKRNIDTYLKNKLRELDQKEE